MRHLIVGFALVGASIAGPISATELKTKIGGALSEAAAEGRFSGAVLVAKDGKPVYEGAFGKTGERANKSDQQFNLASANKPFTAVAIMRLVEQSRVSLDATLDTYLGGEWIPLDLAKQVTIRQLLAHRSGLGDYLDRAGKRPCEALQKIDDYKPLVADQTLEFTPGTKSSYSNVGFLLLGAVIEKVTGESYDAHIHRTLLDPLGMKHTTASRLPVSGEKPDPAACKRRGGPAGGYQSTVKDMLRFAYALQQGKLVKPETLALMRTSTPDNPGYGLGLTVRGGHIGHSGGAPGVSTRFRAYPDGYIVIALSNMDDGAQEAFARIEKATGIGAP